MSAFDKGDEITIRRVENGFLVLPRCEPGMLREGAAVFQRMGWSAGSDGGPQTLLDFIFDHFGQPENEKK